MLVLSRKRGEKILINPGQPDEIVLSVVEIRSDKVRLGIVAPPSVRIDREELLERRNAEGNQTGSGPRPH